MSRRKGPGSIPCQAQEGPYPLAWGQRGMWLGEQLHPEEHLFKTFRVLRLEGPLDPARLRGAVQEVVDRFEVLRSVVTVRGGEPFQVPVPVAVRLPVVDLTRLTGVPDGACGRAAEREVRRAVGRPFPLAEGPLFRFVVLRLGPEDHLWLLNFHHLVFDGVSIGNLVDGVFGAYLGEGPPAPKIQYRDYAAWQLDRLASGRLDASRRYWEERLSGELPTLELPADRPRSGAAGHGAAVCRRVLPKELLDGLAALRKERGSTMLRTFQAGLTVLLSRLTGETDLVVGSPLAGRTHPDLADQLGFFVNTVGIRSDLSGDPKLVAVLDGIDEAIAQAVEHQEYPFDKLVAELKTDRDLHREPIYSVACARRFLTPPARFGDLAVSHWEGFLDTVLYDLLVMEAPTDDGLLVVFQYRRDLFDRTTVERWIGSLEQILRGVVERPTARLSELPLLGPAETHQVLVEWNDTASRYPRQPGLAELFERRAAEAPDALAVEVEVEGSVPHWVSYGELDRRAGRVAHRLRRLRVGRGSLVALLMAPSAAAVAAMVGIVKAGGAYLPLDPSYPESRLELMLEDAAPAVLVTDRRPTLALGPGLREGGPAVLVVGPGGEDSGDDLTDRQAGGPGTRSDGDDLAYVIYTSGSTGRPKGVAVQQRAVSRLVLDTDYVDLTPDDRIAHASNNSFDAATFEIWGALLNGACLTPVSEEVLLSPVALDRALERRRITTLFLTTALFNQVARERPRAFAGLRTLLFGGEAVDPGSVREVLAECPFGPGGTGRLLHVYGPTENTTFSTWHRVTEVAPAASTVPIGGPIAATTAVVLDPSLGLVAPGTVGALYLGGDGLSRGYLGRPGLTAERFVPDPLSGRSGPSGGRLYRTGDLVTLRRDGGFDFVGRIDEQVKIRGFRVELGEVEARLVEYPGVRACAVVAPRDAAGSRALVAYVVAPGVESAALVELLRERLPAFMVPAFWVSLDHLPLTPNGKVDRRELMRRGVEPAGGSRVGEAEAPRYEIEARLARIWSRVLDLPAVGVHDDFFDLGGHSLVAVRILARISEAFGREVSLKTLFENPTIAGLARSLAGGAEGVGEGRARAPVLPRTEDVELPLSFGQQRLWFLEQMLQGRSPYQSRTVWSLRGPLDVAALARACGEVVRRHEALRTSFPSRSGQPVQVVREAPATALPVVDLSGLAAGRREGEMRRLMAREGRRGFDLDKDLLLRGLLIRLDRRRGARREHVLLLIVHHIAFDAWSQSLLAREIEALYGAFSRGEPSPLPPLPVQYPDYALWERTWLDGPAVERQLEPWKALLAGAPTSLELPTDRPRPPISLYGAGHHLFAVDREVAEGLRALGRSGGWTLFMTLLAAFDVLLYRHTGQRDLVVGSPIANRGHREVEPLIGFFVNTLPLRAELAGTEGFRELAARQSEVALAAFGAQEVPFEKLVEVLQPERALSHEPFFQVVFQLLSAPPSPPGLSGLKVASLEPDIQRTSFELAVTLREEEAGGLAGDVLYAADLFDATTVERLFRCFRRLLAAAAADPDRPVAELPILSAAERAQMLHEWNDTAIRLDAPATVRERFEARASEGPDRIAVVDGGYWSYGELDRRGALLAERLRREGVGAESVVALSLRRSALLVVGALGAWKAGAAFLPLDPGDPPGRRAFALDDAGVRVLLTEEVADGELAAGGWTVVTLGEELFRGSGRSAGTTPRPLDPDRLAYVIYTSGSTGRPKGVALAHGGLANLVSWFERTFALVPGDRTTQVSGASFDALLFETWPALSCGAALHVVDGESRSEPAALLDLLERLRIDVCWLPTPLAEAVLREPWPAGAAVRALSTAGDRLHGAAVERPPLPVWNLYGPTEGTIMATFWRVEPAAGDPPIGRPMDNVRVHVASPALEPVPLGTLGELLIGGAGVARGYLGRPALTAERFVPDPFGEAAGARLYRSGDLVRRRGAGEIEFAGRIDHQVKVRGFRIELGEVEEALMRHPEVEAAVVTVSEAAAGDGRLVAHVVPADSAQDGPGALPERLRRALREGLPEYMVPPVIRPLEALPVGPTGKVDRAALVAAGEGPGERTAHAEPTTPLEARLVDVWRQVLGVERVGVHDDFFELGGHSLLATRVVSKVRDLLDREVSLRMLFEEPTVAGLAGRIEAALPERARPRVERLGRPRSVPVSYAQKRIWLHERLTPGSPFFHIGSDWRLCGALDLRALAGALREIVRRHEVLRTCFPARDGRPIQLLRADAEPLLAVVDLSGLDRVRREAELRRVLRTEQRQPFDLAIDPMVRTRLVRLGAEGGEPAEHALLLTFHHIAFDGWSHDVLHRELSALYGAFAAGESSPLPEPAVQYVDYTLWQETWLRGETLDGMLESWRDRLAGAPAILDLPTDRPRPAVPSFRGHLHRLRFDPALGAALEALGRETGATLFMTLLAAFAVQLRRVSGQADLVVGTPVANRETAELEPLVGCFVNLLPVPVAVPAGRTFRQLLRSVADTTLGAYMHQGLPFERLVEELQVERDASRHPLVQVTFQLLHAPPGSLALPGVGSERLQPDIETALFDLSVSVWQEPSGGLTVSALASRDLFDPSTVARSCRQLRTLLEGIAARPGAPGLADLPVGELPLLGSAERHQLIHEWGTAPAPAVDHRPVHELVERCAATAPDTIAVAEDGACWSYGALLREADALADRLRRLGVGTDRVVAVCVEPGAAFPRAALAVLLAGGAYLPLDPSHPRARLVSMVEDSGAPVLLTDGPSAALFEEGFEEVEIRHLQLDEAPVPEGAVLPSDRQSERSALGDLAYVIYTSGSTGRPKGVAVPHLGLANLVAWHRDRFDLVPGERTAQVAALGFDASVWEVWSALGAGATLHVAAEAVRLHPRSLLGWLVRERIESCFLPTPLAEAVLGEPRPEGLSLCTLLTGGDRLHGRSVRWLPPRLVNNYGPTEGSVVATSSEVREVGVTDPPIGRPIDRVETLILDPLGRPVPIGAAGELVIRGPSLARGYLGRPGWTAERFVPDPLPSRPGGRLYRTGDLVRHRADGEIEFRGRLDHQVKIRGFRIEIGEIEAALERQAGVEAALVVTRAAPDGAKSLVAYLVLASPEEGVLERLRAALRDELPAYMVPSYFVEMEAFPLTPSGKLDRSALPAPDLSASVEALPPRLPRTGLERRIAAIWEEVLGRESVDRESNFFDLGGHSLLLVQVHERLERLVGRGLSIVELFQNPTVASLAAHLGGGTGGPSAGTGEVTAEERRATATRAQWGAGSDEIAVVGMAGRFPGSPDLDAFWRNLRDGVESITWFDEEEPDPLEPTANGEHPVGYVKARGILDGADLFDAGFFDMTPREAELMDPQQRLFLETTWQALEHAGYDPSRHHGRIGVFAGTGQSSYWTHFIAPAVRGRRDGAYLQAFTANDKDFLATRVAYKLDLRGPALTIQTACSTSLVAIHQACQALRSGGCDMALAGGVSVSFPQRKGYVSHEGGIWSPDGHCRTFDASAAGTVLGSGVGAVVLKCLDSALADGDAVLAVIKATAVNNDGSLKVGYTAPSVAGQAGVIREAIERAGVRGEEIGLVEAHGTATELGDPIEVEALSQAFGPPNGGARCALGSVKTNVGHLDAAAGVAGFIKTVLALRHRQLPPSLNFDRPNPRIDFERTPFFVNTRLREWPNGSAPRRAGVSSFGLGGTNAHAIVEEAPPAEALEPSVPWQPMVLSARSEEALDRATRALGAHLREHPEIDLADAAYTLGVGRKAFAHRRFVVAKDREDAIRSLLGESPDRVRTGVCRDSGRPVAFMFPGLGPHHLYMARGLFETEPVFRRELDRCAECFEPHVGLDLRSVIYPSREELEEAAAWLQRIEIILPALFAVELALARLWMSWGVHPESMIGYSTGEHVAACLAEVFSFEDSVALMATRARLFAETPRGAMLSVLVPAEEVEPLLDEEVSLAVINDPGRCVVSGSVEGIADLAERLDAAEMIYRPLETEHAYHSWMMEPILEELGEVVARAEAAPPKIPYISNLTGTWITAEEAGDPAYWKAQLRRTVQFSAGIDELASDPRRIVLEVGPGQGLTRAVRRHGGPDGTVVAVASLGRSSEPEASEREQFFEALGELWLAGASVSWPRLQSGVARRRVTLPSYPFERRRFWFDASGRAAAGAGAPRFSPAGHAAPAPGTVATAGPRRVEPAPGGPRPALGRAVSRKVELIERQLQVMAGQLDLLKSRRVVRGSATEPSASVRSATPPVPAPSAPTPAEPAAIAPPPVRAPLTPIQRWYLGHDLVAPHHFNLAGVYEIEASLSPTTVAAAWRQVTDRHGALRLRFPGVGAEEREMVESAGGSGSFAVVDLSSLPTEDHRRAIGAAAAAVQAGSDLASGPLARAVCFTRGPTRSTRSPRPCRSTRSGRLLVVCHHLVVDLTSWRILEEDLAAACEALARGRAPALHPEGTSFVEWARRLDGYARSPELRRELDHWLSGARERSARLEPDFDRGVADVASVRSLTVDLSAGETEALARDVARSCGAQLSDAVLAALARVIAGRTGADAVLVQMEGHGREEDPFEGVDLSRTVGWFTSSYPLLVELPEAGDGETVLRRVKEQVRAVPRGGIGYGLLRYAAGDPEIARRLAALPPVQVSFNYLGKGGPTHGAGTRRGSGERPASAGLALRPSDEPLGPTRDPREECFFLLEIYGLLVDGRLRLEWRYSENRFERSTVDTLVRQTLATLRSLSSARRGLPSGGPLGERDGAIEASS